MKILRSSSPYLFRHSPFLSYPITSSSSGYYDHHDESSLIHRFSPILYYSASSLSSSYVSLIPKWLIQITSHENMTWQILNLLDSSPLDSICVYDLLVPSCCSVMLRCDSMSPSLIFLPPLLSSARSAAVKSQHVLWWSFSIHPIIKPTDFRSWSFKAYISFSHLFKHCTCSLLY